MNAAALVSTSNVTEQPDPEQPTITFSGVMVTIDVPGNKGVLLQSGRGVIFADVNIQWWATRIQNLNSSLGYADPTHLPLYNDVLNFVGNNPLNCCVIGCRKIVALYYGDELWSHQCPARRPDRHEPFHLFFQRSLQHLHHGAAFDIPKRRLPCGFETLLELDSPPIRFSLARVRF
jgi:hypothetical protein